MTANLFPVQTPKGWKKLAPALLSIFLVGVIGIVDYLVSYQISLYVFYLLPLGIATIYVGPLFAAMLAVCCVVISKGGDLLTGMPYGTGVLIWNSCIAITFFFILIALIHVLNRVLLGLESKVESRNRDLLQEMTNRARLEKEIIDLSEREHRRFGQELHDLVSQELAGIAIDMHLLTRSLLASEHNQADRSRELALKVDRSLSRARNLARGFFTVGFDTAGLAEALGEIASCVEKTNQITCAVRCQENFIIGSEDATIQLFRIAQEAVQNAVKHAAASRIDIIFERADNAFRLAVRDNGRGLPSNPPPTKAIGLYIMAYRASLIGGELTVESLPGGGTQVTCTVPAEKLLKSTAPANKPSIA